jgi:drug/metabolite transporter (DMT)-like permease
MTPEAKSPERAALGVLLALGAVFLWGTNAVIARHLSLEGVSMTAVAFLRTLIGGLGSNWGHVSTRLSKISFEKRPPFVTIPMV